MKKLVPWLCVVIILFVVYKLYTAFQPAPGQLGVSGLTVTDND